MSSVEWQYFNPRTLTGATKLAATSGMRRSISIHAPLRVRHQPEPSAVLVDHFNPRTLTGATVQEKYYYLIYRISIHAPLRVRQTTSRQTKSGYKISIHAPLRVRPAVDSQG